MYMCVINSSSPATEKYLVVMPGATPPAGRRIYVTVAKSVGFQNKRWIAILLYFLFCFAVCINEIQATY